MLEGMNITGTLILLANLGVLALNIKLYTEILKNDSLNRRINK